MKKTFLTLFSLLAICATTFAQDSLRIKVKPAEVSTILEALEVLNLKMFSYDLSSFLSDTYSITIYVDEYERGEKVKRYREVRAGENRIKLSELPDDFEKYVRETNNIPSEEKLWNKINELKLFISQKNDSTALATINITNAIKTWVMLKMHPLDDNNSYFYQTRPFVLRGLSDADSLNIPLLLYGSGWKDPEYGFYRFCGEKEIESANQASSILKNSPHYFIIGLELKKVGE